MGNSTGTGREPRFPPDPDPLGKEELTDKLDILENRYKKIQKNLLYIRDKGKVEEIAKDISEWNEIIGYIQGYNQLPVNERGESLSKRDLINNMKQSLTKASTLEFEILVKRVNEKISRKREEGEGTYDEVTDDIIQWLSKNYSWVPYSSIEDKGVRNKMIDDGQNEQGRLDDLSF